MCDFLVLRQMFSAVVSALDESIGRIVQVGFGFQPSSVQTLELLIEYLGQIHFYSISV